MEKAYRNCFPLREMETLRKTKKGNLEINNTVTEMKNIIDGIPGLLDQSKKAVSLEPCYQKRPKVNCKEKNKNPHP